MTIIAEMIGSAMLPSTWACVVMRESMVSDHWSDYLLRFDFQSLLHLVQSGARGASNAR